MQKPERYTFKEFLLNPVHDGYLLLKFRILKKLGWWYCEYCEKLHSPLVIKYTVPKSIFKKVKTDGEVSDTCSLLIENCEV